MVLVIVEHFLSPEGQARFPTWIREAGRVLGDMDGFISIGQIQPVEGGEQKTMLALYFANLPSLRNWAATEAHAQLIHQLAPFQLKKQTSTLYETAGDDLLAPEGSEARAIRELIEFGYLNGALNTMNTPAMREAYHPDFAIFYPEEDQLGTLPLESWIRMVETFKSERADHSLRIFTCEFEQIDVTGQAAAVKLRLFRGGQLIFTDYITLLKFGDRWKIVTKVYHAHVADPWAG